MRIYLCDIILEVNNQMNFNLRQILRFRIVIQTIKDNFKATIILSLLFSGMAAMYAGMYPQFSDMMVEMQQSGALDQFSFISGYQDMASYVGFLNVEMYQIFWILILGIVMGFIAATSISKEIESKTIDILMSNPVSRKQIIFEKFIGLIPMILFINFSAMLVIIAITIGINEELNFVYLFLTHVISIPYFLSIIAIAILISTIIDEKMRAGIVTMAIVVVMYIFESIGNMIPDYENIGFISLTHYYSPYETLKNGNIDVFGTAVLIFVVVVSLILAIIYFDRKDIKI